MCEQSGHLILSFEAGWLDGTCLLKLKLGGRCWQWQLANRWLDFDAGFP